ncbi:MAG: MlrC C-terminal domain-containing protein, partial [Alphaproteobacteria bacterium]|nr:MlrC C-terminal domain-containing protein [Alphaproteobacteria bacterium]
ATIAQSYWDAREDFRFGPVTGPLAEMLDIAESTETRPIILADSGDNPTGGGVGDRADVLKALLTRSIDEVLIAGITDRPAIERCFKAGVGSRVTLMVGGSLDPASAPVEVEAIVVLLDDPGSAADQQAVVRIGDITLVLAARRRPYHNIADFTRLGLDPSKVRLLVVKSGYLSPELSPVANPNLMALTDGVINQDIENLPSHRRHQPSYPFVKDFGYTAKVFFSTRFP